MEVKRIVILAVLILLIFAAQEAHALILINEFLADPASGLAGDANNDGIRDSSDDEFIEILNAGTENVDISGWYFSDATKTRHVFGPDTIFEPNDIFVIFGGGSPDLGDINWFVASSGSLGLNNTSDVVALFDLNGQVVDQIAYGSEAGDNQSLTRYPEGTFSDFIKHSSHPNANGALFSPGYFVGSAVVPEPSTIYSFLLLFSLVICKTRHFSRIFSF